MNHITIIREMIYTNRNYKLYVHIAPNGKKYYGITMQKPEKRWLNGRGYDTQYFARAINKYGWGNIEHIVIYDDLTESEAKELEQYYIQWYDTTNPQYGYNITTGGEGASGYTHTEEAKQKIGAASKGKPRSEEIKQKISQAQKGEKHHMYGKHHSEGTKQKISESNKGKNHTEDTKKKIGKANKGKQISEEQRKIISKANKGKQLSEETKQKIGAASKGRNKGKNNSSSRSVICITTNRVFYAVMDAERYYNIPNTSIVRCCKGKRKSAGKSPDGEKLVWKYIDIIEL